ncbi:MAG: hypothetical protein Q4B69_03190 [Slackia sp.]|nr:hypothetical protein [Slackia sp.]
MKAYDVIARTIGAQPDRDSVRWVDSVHMRSYRFWSILGLAGCFLCLLGPLFSIPFSIQLIGLGAGVVCMVLRTLQRKGFEAVVASALDMKCDPALYCRWTLAFLATGRPAGGYARGVWDYAYGLMWQGKWNEAITLARTLECDLDVAVIAFAYNGFMADCAFALRDPDKLSAYIEALRTMPQRRIARDARLHAAELEPLRDLLVHERDGNFDAARAIADEILADQELLPLERVLMTLHKAECTSDASEKRALLDYVQQNGGSTWCAARARMLAAEL